MIPSPAELQRISALRSGNLSDVPFGLLLRAFSDQQSNVVLELQREPIVKRVVIENGQPVDCESNLVHERLGRFLVAIGRLSETDFASSFSEALREETPLGQVLVRRQLLAPSELFRVLQQNLAKKLLDLFSWHEGHFQIERDMPPIDSALKVKASQLILTGVTRFASQAQVDLVVMQLLGKRLALNPASPVADGELRLTMPQRRLVEALQKGPREMSELGQAARIESNELSRVIYALGLLGVLGTEQEVRERASDQDARATQAIQIPVLEPEEALLSQEDLMQLYLGHRRKGPFELLGVDRQASPRKIELAFLEFAKRLRPWAYAPQDGLRDKASDLFLAGARAFAQLTDRDLRSKVLDKPAPPPHETQPLRVGPMRIETDLLDPEAQYDKAKTLIAEREYRKALQYLAFAADCDPQNGLYRAEHAYYRYLADPSDSERSLEELKEARRIDPGCGLGFFYAGEILRDLQRFDEAEPLLEAAIKPMAPDRRPIDALRELAKQAKRKRRR